MEQRILESHFVKESHFVCLFFFKSGALIFTFRFFSLFFFLLTTWHLSDTEPVTSAFCGFGEEKEISKEQFERDMFLKSCKVLLLAKSNFL